MIMSHIRLWHRSKRAVFYSPRRSFSQHNSKSSPSTTTSESGRDAPYLYLQPPSPPETWLTRYLRSSPRAMDVFMKTIGVLGMTSPKQQAGSHTYHIYHSTCATMETEDTGFWHNECHLPSTFQSWFTITNLHVWLLTVRFRALPQPFGTHYVQGLIDHFFLDVEDRVRQVLSKKASERLVTRQMKILREQWAGLGLSFDYSLGLSSPYCPSDCKDGDVEMAAAIWRNLLGARGAQGIGDPGPGKVRRSINLSGEIGMPKLSSDAPEKSLKQLEETDDGSGVHDFSGEDTLLYVKYPALMYTMVEYVRMELTRLEGISDEQIMCGEGLGMFGRPSKLMIDVR